MKCSKRIRAVALIVGLLITIFVLKDTIASRIHEEQIKKETVLATEGKEKRVSKWLTYWDLENGIRSLKQNDLNQDISFFAAYFNEDGEIFVPKALSKSIYALVNANERSDARYYLTVVNDQINQDSSSSLKSTELVAKLIVDDSDRMNHINQLLDLVEEYNLDGIEIDYEGLTKAPELTQPYLEFLSQLYAAASQRSITLRVIIEYKMLKDEQYQFVEGPEYVIMCYNLFGSSSEPGPKANYDFLKHIVKLMERIPGKVIYALANGGFDWGEEVQALTTKEAKALAKERCVVESRDQESSCLYYTYTDKYDKEHIVWYGDEETIKEWIEFLNKQGSENIAIWRLE